MHGPACPKCGTIYEWSCGEIEELVVGPKLYFCERCMNLFILWPDEVYAIQRRLRNLEDGPSSGLPVFRRLRLEEAGLEAREPRPREPVVRILRGVYRGSCAFVVHATDSKVLVRVRFTRVFLWLRHGDYRAE